MGTRVPTYSNALCGGSLLLVMSMLLCRAEDPILTSEFIRKVDSAIDNRTVNPSCFITEFLDLTCFWESNTSDASKFIFYYKPEEPCSLTTLNASEDTWWHLCQFPQEDVNLFPLNPYSVTVWDFQTNTTLCRRQLIQESVVYLEPPSNITVREQRNPLGLLITFKNPVKDLILKDCLMYEVVYTNDKGQNSMIFQKSKVRSEDGYVMLFLEKVKRDAVYTINVRTKADEPYNGYWSVWAMTTFQTSNGFDEIHMLMFGFAGFVVNETIEEVVYDTCMPHTSSLTHVCPCRFLKRKMWPDIPTPEHHFKELYTTHKGNFKTWLGQTDSYLTWISRNIFHEGPITTLEVLSELPNVPPSILPPVPLPPKDSYVALDENILPPLLAWMVSTRQDNVQRAQFSPADEKTMRTEGRPRDPEDIRQPTAVEEPATAGTEIMKLKGPPSSRAIFREDSLNSEEGTPSPASSFEYTVLETCDGLLSPRTRSIPPRQPLKYAYLLMSESGEESPPPSPNIYQNSLCGQFPAPVYSQC
ncbi:PREDICTED: erythropoietin receptor [Nanorana parkeri]|uniref:erythropoietin receptor n=1 Tax=Nanorana parkeri TaxID=125878 RepID=UPI000854F712|nr:PREDICTED: erythropoietin receptor [Nanorana parkeri]